MCNVHWRILVLGMGQHVGQCRCTCSRTYTNMATTRTHTHTHTHATTHWSMHSLKTRTHHQLFPTTPIPAVHTVDSYVSPRAHISPKQPVLHAHTTIHSHTYLSPPYVHTYVHTCYGFHSLKALRNQQRTHQFHINIFHTQLVGLPCLSNCRLGRVDVTIVKEEPLIRCDEPFYSHTTTPSPTQSIPR